MKRTIIVAALVLFAIAVKAQQPPGPPKPPSIEERIKKTNEVLQKEIQLNAAQKTAIETAFKKFFTAEDKLRKDNLPPPPPPLDPKMKEAMDKLVKGRDEQVKKVLTDEQYKKYKEAAKKLHPPKPPGQNGQPASQN
ncbi:MAG: hypothetical protein SGI96_13435 [Bacteroidota bacterium]|nr:hypothetical protein [Bacteroidota bacterium]